MPNLSHSLWLRRLDLKSYYIRIPFELATSKRQKLNIKVHKYSQLYGNEQSVNVHYMPDLYYEMSTWCHQLHSSYLNKFVHKLELLQKGLIIIQLKIYVFVKDMRIMTWTILGNGCVSAKLYRNRKTVFLVSFFMLMQVRVISTGSQ